MATDAVDSKKTARSSADEKPVEIKEQVTREIEESISVKKDLALQAAERIAEIALAVVERMKAGGKLIIFGNGGSAADAQHIAAEFVGRYQCERRPLPAIALTTNASSLTAIGNDYGFEETFSRQILALANAGDVILAISTSGNSPNVLRGLTAARQMGLLTVGLTGRSGGGMRVFVDLCLCVPSDSTPRVQEAHILVGHILSGIVERAFLSEAAASRSAHLATAPRR